VFDRLKAQFFGTANERTNVGTINAKLMAFHYMLMAHRLVGTTASGCGEIHGDDVAITLGAFGPVDASGHQRGTTSQQAGTVMHELGHNLGLDHGGGDRFNCKPNYLSVMSYTFQFTDFVPDRVLDYSRGDLPTLDEMLGLNESLGIGTVTSFPFLDGKTTMHAVPTSSTAVPAFLGLHPDPSFPNNTINYGSAIDWNGNNTTADSAVKVDTNQLAAAGCTGEGTVLEGHDDWANLQYSSRASLDFGSGVTLASDDKTAEQEQASFELYDSDKDGIRDAFGCGSNSVPCAIDIKPGENPPVLHKSTESNIKVRILSVPNLFDAPVQVIRESLMLNKTPVLLNQQGRGTCNAITSTGGRQDLDCQFPASALPVGTNYSILEGLARFGTSTRAFRARDVVTVVNP
jgi:hypothetical protein